jgi:hypothetical protein
MFHIEIENMKNKRTVGPAPLNSMPIARTPDDVSKLIRKLRWIGLEEDARQLQRAMLTLSPEHLVTVPSEPSNTD